jgi:hypothetical protein
VALAVQEPGVEPDQRLKVGVGHVAPRRILARGESLATLPPVKAGTTT